MGGGGTIDLTKYPTIEDAERRQGTMIGNGLDNRLTLDGGGTILGNGGNDTIEVMFAGGNKRVSMDGGSGDDTLIDPDAGLDTLNGGAGNDTIQGFGKTAEQIDHQRRAATETTPSVATAPSRRSWQ